MAGYAVLGAQRALMEPTLTEWGWRYGAPTTTTPSPARTVLESAIGDTDAPGGTRSSCNSDRSAAAGSEATTRADTVSPPGKTTEMSSMACTTWAAVITLPSAEMRTPEPVSVKRVWPPDITSRPRARTVTTDDAAFWNTS